MTSRALTFRSRQALLFVIAIVVPCALLVLLTVRMLVQDRELADKRVTDERRRMAADARQTLLARVERLRLAAGESTSTLPEGVALVVRVDGGRVQFPWDRADALAPTSAPSAAFTDAIRRGEQLEFALSRFAGAAIAYQSAAKRAQDAGQRAMANLLAARVMAKARRSDEARQLARPVLETHPSIVDDQGIPFAVYAARLLLEWESADAAGAISASLARVTSSPTVGPAALYMARDVLHQIDGSRETRSRVQQRLDDIEMALALREALPTLGVLSSAGAPDPVWTTFGPQARSWLVSAVRVNGDHMVLTAVRTASVLATMASSTPISVSKDGESMAPSFPTLTVTISPEIVRALAAEGPLRQPFYIAAIALVVGVALVGAYLFWRDADREIRLAALRSQFVASVSHELKTPLTAIRMFAETLLMGRSTDPQVQAEYLETIVSESERLTRLLNNVLDFSKIESGLKSYHLEGQSLGDVVRAAARAVHYPFSQHGFDLSVTVDDTLPPVAIDADAIEQAILNLLSNAMKYSGDARAIRLSLARDGDEAVIAVADEGVGIASDEQHRIFEKFYRVRSGPAERVAGAGLGLTLVDHVMKGHGGRVSVRSAPGQGSVFSLHLPIVASAHREPHAAGALA